MAAGVTDAFKKDTAENKVNLGVGECLSCEVDSRFPAGPPMASQCPLTFCSLTLPRSYTARYLTVSNVSLCAAHFLPHIAPTDRRIRGFCITPKDPSIIADVWQRDENGKPWVLQCVLKAENILQEKRSDKEYLPITVRSLTCHVSTLVLTRSGCRGLHQARLGARVRQGLEANQGEQGKSFRT